MRIDLSSTSSGGATSFSVVVPTCDRGELLRNAVQSALAQTYAPLEVLIVNNGNEALTVAFPNSNVRVVEVMRYAGAAQARNIGAVLAAGDYIAFLDDDDQWRPDYLEQVAARIDETKADLIFGSIEGGKTARPVDVSDFLTRNPGVVGSTTTVRRTAFLRVGGYAPRLEPSEDKALAVEMLLRGFTVEPAPSAITIMPQHQLPHLSRPENFARGIAEFQRKYGHLMTRRDRLTNRARKASAEFQARPRFWSRFRLALARSSLFLDRAVEEIVLRVPRLLVRFRA